MIQQNQEQKIQTSESEQNDTGEWNGTKLNRKQHYGDKGRRQAGSVEDKQTVTQKVKGRGNTWEHRRQNLHIKAGNRNFKIRNEN